MFINNFDTIFNLICTIQFCFLAQTSVSLLHLLKPRILWDKINEVNAEAADICDIPVDTNNSNDYLNSIPLKKAYVVLEKLPDNYLMSKNKEPSSSSMNDSGMYTYC